MGKPLFYRDVVALNSETHRDLRLKPLEHPLEFARQANLIPAIIDEFSLAMADLPIAFLPGERQPVAVFVAGLRPSENLFITDDGLWDGRYAPAYLRRYPFILGDVEGGEPLLCVDQAFEGLDWTDGERLFNDSGEIEEHVHRALTLAVSYRDSAERTDRFCAMLRDMGLLKSVTLDATLPSGEKTSMHGLLVVDEEALAAIGPEDLHKLHQDGFLGPIYFHLVSLGTLPTLAQRVRADAAASNAATGGGAAGAETGEAADEAASGAASGAEAARAGKAPARRKTGGKTNGNGANASQEERTAAMD